MHLATVVAAIGLLDAFSAPGCYVEEAIIFSLAYLFLIAVSLVRLIAALTTRRCQRRQWLLAPNIGVITVTLIWLGARRICDFQSAKRVNTSAQAEIAVGPRALVPWGTGTIKRAGAYHVMAVQVTPTGEVDFVVPDTFLGRSCSGFTFSPAARPPTREDRSSRLARAGTHGKQVGKPVAC